MKYKSTYSLLTAIVLLTIVFLFNSCQQDTETTKPVYRDMIISVYAPAVVQPKNLYRVYPKTGGTITKIYINEGDTVVASEVLAKLESDKASYEMETMQLQKELAEQKLSGNNSELQLLDLEIKKLRAQLTTDSINYARRKTLWLQEIGSKTELDQLKLKYDLSRKSLESAITRRENTKLELDNRLEQAEVLIGRSNSLLSDYTIEAATAGKIYNITKEEGESILPQEYFAEIGSAEQFIIELQVDEKDIAKLHVGQELVLNLDAYSGDVFKAKLTKIYPSKNIRTQSFKLEAEFIKLPEKLYAGLSGEANIITNEEKDVLSIPLEYLTTDNKVVTEDGEIEITLGDRNMQYVHIIEGIDSTTIIQKPD